MSDSGQMCVTGGRAAGREEAAVLTMSMEDTGPMLLTYMPTSMTVGFTARARRNTGVSDGRTQCRRGHV